MGEAKNKPLKLEFNRRLRLEFHGAKVTSDAGLFVYREFNEMVGLTAAENRDKSLDNGCWRGITRCQ